MRLLGRFKVALLAAVVAGAVLCAVASSAGAQVAYVRSFGSGVVGGEPWGGSAVDSAGNVYVADGTNNRIDEFSATGAFVKAFGWGVADGLAKLETCTTSCEVGQSGGGAGEFAIPTGVAIDAAGDLFMSDYGNFRVDEFST